MMTARKVFPHFADHALNPLSYYNLLPSDEPQFADVTPLSVNALIAEVKAWTQKDLQRVSLEEMDTLLAQLFASGAEPIVDDALLILAHQACVTFTALLADYTDRPRRMRMQLLAYCLRDKTNVFIPAENMRTEQLDYTTPWDIACVHGERVVACSGEQNVFVGAQAFTVGLPTQLDVVGERLYIGSTYTEGLHFIENNALIHIPFAVPLLCAGRDFVLDLKGGLHAYANDKVGERIGQLTYSTVYRARIIGAHLYVMDWGRCNEILQVEIGSWKEKIIPLADIFICNDIVGYKDGYYALDKEQGYVFAYDAAFNLRDKRLGFGRKDGHLLDPIGIRVQDGRIEIINWVSGTLVSLDCF